MPATDTLREGVQDHRTPSALVDGSNDVEHAGLTGAGRPLGPPVPAGRGRGPRDHADAVGGPGLARRHPRGRPERDPQAPARLDPQAGETYVPPIIEKDARRG